MDTITPADLKRRIQDGAAPFIIDVRDPHEFQDHHLDPGNGTIHNIPYRQYDDLSQIASDLPTDIDEPLHIICWTGVCSQRVANALEQEGFEAVSVDGGMEAV